MCSLFWFSCQHLQSDWLVRLLSKCLVESWRLSPQKPGWRVLLCVRFRVCFVLLCVVPSLTQYVLLWHNVACLCWKSR